MRRGAGRLTASVFLAVLAAVPRVRALETRTTLIWYRSAEGCPDGPQFLVRLESRGVRARLARVGEPIDFVVTLGTGPDGARGLLERQTETKTVAIRQLDGGTCDQVADAIALSLVVANTPRAEDAPVASVVSPAPPPAERPTPIVAARPTPPERLRWALGFQGGALFGAAPAPLLATDLFVDLRLPSSGVLREPVLRLAALEMQSSTSGSAHVAVFVVGGRVEACPLRLGTPVVGLSPCVATTLGAIRSAASGPAGLVDHGFWGAVDFLGRLSFRVARPVSVELQGAAVVPMERYEFVSEKTGYAYHVPAVGFSALAGAAVRLP
jgi:hypothetical protein